MIQWYDKSGKVIKGTDLPPTDPKWVKAMSGVEKLLEDKKYKVIQQDYTPNKKYWVSTIWLGLDHSFGVDFEKPNPHPVIFETMVFEAKLSKQKPSKVFPKGFTYRKDLEQERYETETQALAGHQKWLKKYNLKDKHENRR